MMSPDPAVRVIAWQPAWALIRYEAGLGAVLSGFGLGLGVIAERVAGLSGWLAVPAVLLWCLAGLLLFAGAGILCVRVAFLLYVHWTAGFVIVSVHADSLWISESPRLDLFFKTMVVPFGAIVRVERDRGPSGVESLRIIHGAALKVEVVSEIRSEDLAALIAILEERCPTAFTAKN
jgi:hypothetical protein